jgi:hypothetical protein
MTRTYLPPNQARQIADLEQRLDRLERRITSAGAGADNSHEIPFSFDGVLSVKESPPIRPRWGGRLTVLAVSFGTAGSTDTVLEVKRNGTTVATVTVPASTEDYNGTVGVRFAAGVDRLTLAVVTAGTGAAGMTADAWFN